ncbi:hypothetical protein AB833_09515 [Chromatiales bacterium (ex Bugula neritina AB1)]|nr:hypothetical protein AB833_09515 [Chromatiales bacterium (ex Bugula neritina AB1)]
MTTRVLVPSGVLGLGFDSAALAAGVATRPDIIAIDGGSTDSGPYYLGTGTSKYSRAACKAEWKQLMLAREQAQVPLVITSCGTCGTDSMVEWMLEITRELAAELSQQVTVATLYSEVSPDLIKEQLVQGRILPLAPAFHIDAASVESIDHIVALAGAEQINAALATGADIVLAGRATDTAGISAMPLARGEQHGAAWHGAKIAECGALCSTNPTSGVIALEVDKTGFSVWPLAEAASCTPHSVSAHMLYENADPHTLYEPGGALEVHDALYKSIDEKRVRVTGSRWVPSDQYTVKLEGARSVGYQSTLMAILRDARYVANAKVWVDRLTNYLEKEIASRMGLAKDDYDVEFRLIGVDAALGELEVRVSDPAEIGVLVLVSAQSEELADELAKLINPFLLHYPLNDNEELPTFAFPYSPAQTNRGAIYEFCLNHVLVLEEPMDGFRLEVHQI